MPYTSSSRRTGICIAASSSRCRPGTPRHRRSPTAASRRNAGHCRRRCSAAPPSRSRARGPSSAMPCVPSPRLIWKRVQYGKRLSYLTESTCWWSCEGKGYHAGATLGWLDKNLKDDIVVKATYLAGKTVPRYSKDEVLQDLGSDCNHDDYDLVKVMKELYGVSAESILPAFKHYDPLCADNPQLNPAHF